MEIRIRKFDDVSQTVKSGPGSSGIYAGKDANNDWQLKYNPDGTARLASPVQSREVTFTETGGAANYTGSVVLPAGATLLDIIVHGTALWDNAGAVTMKVGDVTDDDGYYTAVNLKATDLLAGESLSFSHAGGKLGAYSTGTNTHIASRYAAAARTISGVVTTASTGGSAGRTRMTVLYSTPVVSAATKV